MELALTSPIFAVALIFTCIVIYDAMGVRYQSGKQATVINDIVKYLNEKQFKEGFEMLKEKLGHKPLEVLGGIALGILVSHVFVKFIF